MQKACARSVQRIAAVQQFVSDVRARAASDADFLSLGAQPLAAASVPASACQ